MERFLKSILREAGKKALSWFKSQDLISLRGTSKEITTKYDKLLDEFFIRKIQTRYPAHNILTEESGFLKGNSHYLWIIDSLDGSSNFANKNPLFSLCIALFKEKTPLMGGIFAPAISEFYFAQRREGAFLNGKRIKVSGVKGLKESYLLYCEGNEKRKKKFLNLLREIYPQVTEVRKIGSAGLEIAWVASGRADGFFTTKIDPWDIGAGIILIEEAGGKVTNFQGEPWQIKRENLIFTNSKIHQDLKRLVESYEIKK